MTFFTGFPFFTVIINSPLRFQIVNGESPIMAGLHLVPMLRLSAVGKIECPLHLKSVLIGSRQRPWRRVFVQEELHLALAHCWELLSTAWQRTFVNSSAQSEY